MYYTKLAFTGQFKKRKQTSEEQKQTSVFVWLGFRGLRCVQITLSLCWVLNYEVTDGFCCPGQYGSPVAPVSTKIPQLTVIVTTIKVF